MAILVTDVTSLSLLAPLLLSAHLSLLSSNSASSVTILFLFDVVSHPSASFLS